MQGVEHASPGQGLLLPKLDEHAQHCVLLFGFLLPAAAAQW